MFKRGILLSKLLAGLVVIKHYILSPKWLSRGASAKTLHSIVQMVSGSGSAKTLHTLIQIVSGRVKTLHTLVQILIVSRHGSVKMFNSLVQMVIESGSGKTLHRLVQKGTELGNAKTLSWLV